MNEDNLICESEEKNTSKKIKPNDTVLNSFHENKNILLSEFKFIKLIRIDAYEKLVIYKASLKDKNGLILLEKLPFDEKNLVDLINKSNNNLEKIFNNDIYGSYHLKPDLDFNKIKVTIIYPATDYHLKKYSLNHISVIEETAEDYLNITLPYIEQCNFSIDWVYNIIDHKQEADRIVLEDSDPETGFILLPDLKWDGINLNNFYLVAIVKKRNIKSIREINKSHLPLLKNVKNKSIKLINEKYNIESNKLRIYFHYQPSYYHLHIHFNLINQRRSRCNMESSHLIDTVINNVEICDDYYKKAKLIFSVKDSDQLLKLFSEKKII